MGKADTFSEDDSSRQVGVEPIFWTIGDIQVRCRVGRTTAWKLVKRCDFPPPVVVGTRKLVWPATEVLSYIESLRREDHYVGDRARESARVAPSSIVNYRVRKLRRQGQARRVHGT